MQRSLVEDIRRGRVAIEAARQRGIDTSDWERRLSELQQQELLGWAGRLSEQDMELGTPIKYTEAPLRMVTTSRVSFYASHYLRAVSYARLSQRMGGWGTWTTWWWKEREDEALGALRALRDAMKAREQVA